MIIVDRGVSFLSMRVIHLACVAPPEIGGIGQVAWQEVRGLVRQGIQAELVTSALVGVRSLQTVSEERAYVLRLPSLVRIGNAAWVRGLRKAVRDADILHLHYPWYGVAERVLWRPSLTPVVVTFHMDATASDWRGRIFDAHRRWMQARLLRHATRILVSSRDYAEHSSLATSLPELEPRLEELPFGVDTDFFTPPVSGRVLPHVEEGQEIFTIAFVGGLDRAHHFKGLEILLAAFAQMDKRARLMIVGEGDRRSVFEEGVRARGLSDRVRFLGRVSRELLRKVYQDADVLAFPSISPAEAFGLVAVEAQSCGLPVVASRLPGVRQVVLDGKTGTLVPPGSVSALREALQDLQDHHTKRVIYGESARAHALDRYSEMRHLEHLVRIYSQICS